MKHTIRIFNACLAIIGHYPPDIPLENAKELSLEAMCCHFVVAAALVSTARREDVLEEKRRLYSSMREHVALFEAELEKARKEDMNGAVYEDLKAKLATLLVFDFEGAVEVGQWDDLREVVRSGEGCGDAVAFKAMADCLLRASGVPSQGEVTSSFPSMQVWNT